MKKNQYRELRHVITTKFKSSYRARLDGIYASFIMATATVVTASILVVEKITRDFMTLYVCSILFLCFSATGIYLIQTLKAFKPREKQKEEFIKFLRCCYKAGITKELALRAIQYRQNTQLAELTKITAFDMYKTRGLGVVTILYPDHVPFCLENTAKTIPELRHERLNIIPKQEIPDWSILQNN